MKFVKYIVVVFIAFTSCKSTKTATDGSLVLKKISGKRIAKKHITNHFDKNTVDAKLKVNFKNEKQKVGLSVKMRIKKDAVIWLKGTKLITVFKAKITPDKVSFYSPYMKNYIEGDFALLEKILGTEINFQQLQNMLLGQALFDLKAERHSVTMEPKAYLLSPKKQPDLFKLFYWINPNHFKLNQQSLVNEIKNQRLDISYPSYKKTKNTLFPEKIKIKAKNAHKFTNIDVLVRSVVFNKAISTPFKIPSGYKEIKL